jgi:hypothetical protein
MLYEAQFAICSETNTKPINTVWQIAEFLNSKSFGASHIQKALKG